MIEEQLWHDGRLEQLNLDEKKQRETREQIEIKNERTALQRDNAVRCTDVRALKGADVYIQYIYIYIYVPDMYTVHLGDRNRTCQQRRWRSPKKHRFPEPLNPVK
jgi:hypothetical protein